MRPCLARICSATFSTLAATDTSSGIASASPPALRIFSTTTSSGALRRPETTTVQPSAASASAPAAPMPVPPPVTQATRFPSLVMQTVSVAFLGLFLLIQPLPKPSPPAELLHEHRRQRQPVFTPVRSPRRSEQACHRNP